MKVVVKHWHAVASWRWDTGADQPAGEEEDVCGICRVAYEGCCPSCKMPGDDCPLSTSIHIFAYAMGSANRAFFAVWGECSHVFHMHCLLKWIGTAASKQQCPMDRRAWGERCMHRLITRLITAFCASHCGEEGRASYMIARPP